MDFEIEWTERATSDLESIVDFISKDSPEAGRRVGKSIGEHVEILGTFPLIGPPYPRASRRRFREIVFGNYRIFYRVIKSKRRVEILTIWHAAREEPDLP